ncbi:Lipoprotein [Chromobacterium violaceum]
MSLCRGLGLVLLLSLAGCASLERALAPEVGITTRQQADGGYEMRAQGQNGYIAIKKANHAAHKLCMNQGMKVADLSQEELGRLSASEAQPGAVIQLRFRCVKYD